MNVFTRICFSFLIILVMSSHAYLAPEITNYPPLDNTTSSQFATYLGGRDIDDCDDIAVDAAGFIYLACHSTSKDFPGFKGQKVSDDMDAYVTKLDPRNGKLIYTSRLSGSKYDGASTIEVTEDGSVFVGGVTDSDDFLTTSDAIQPKLGGKMDAFLVKLKPDGQLDYSTYLGGAGGDFPTALVVDKNQQIYMAGQCQSVDFPGLGKTDSAKKTETTEDGFIALWKIRESAGLRTILLGGSKWDIIGGLAVDHANNYLYVAGQTHSVDFPVKTAFQEKLNGESDAFLAKYRISDLQIIFASYFGGPKGEMGQGVAVDKPAFLILLVLPGLKEFQ
jgi:Beta-propeller repeat